MFRGSKGSTSVNLIFIAENYMGGYSPNVHWLKLGMGSQARPTYTHMAIVALQRAGIIRYLSTHRIAWF
eukprot:1189877-Prorocentrum_minimum.AAC.2